LAPASPVWLPAYEAHPASRETAGKVGCDLPPGRYVWIGQFSTGIELTGAKQRSHYKVRVRARWPWATPAQRRDLFYKVCDVALFNGETSRRLRLDPINQGLRVGERLPQAISEGYGCHVP
jgi:hypothetical protein